MKRSFKFNMFIAVLILFSGCSAEKLAQMALKKDPTIFDLQADTTVVEKITWRDSTIIVRDTIPIKITSDTLIYDTQLVELPKSYTFFVEKSSADSISHARVSIYKGVLKMQVWSTFDTVINWQDSALVKLREVRRLTEIARAAQVTIKEQESFISSLQKWVLVVLGVLLVLIILKFILNPKRK